MYKGERYCASTRQSNAKAAGLIESAKRTALAKAEEGIYEKTPAPTLDDFSTKYFEPRISATVGGSITQQKTWDDFYLVGIRALRNFEPIASWPLDEIDAELIGKFEVFRRTEGEREKSVSTVSASLRVLKRILNKAEEWHTPKKGVFLLAKAPDIELMKGENKREYVVPTVDERKYLLKAATCNELLADFVRILLDTAMRPEECYRIRWEHISWQGGLHGVVQVVRGKADNARRELPMSGRVRTILRARWNDAGRPQEGWVFPAPTKSEHMEPSTLKRGHAKTLEDSKVKRFVLYDLRHTSLTRLACECREFWTVARIAGHGDIKIGQRYVHSHRMERSAWWKQWWAFVSEGRRVGGEVATGEKRENQATTN